MGWRWAELGGLNFTREDHLLLPVRIRCRLLGVKTQEETASTLRHAPSGRPGAANYKGTSKPARSLGSPAKITNHDGPRAPVFQLRDTGTAYICRSDPALQIIHLFLSASELKHPLALTIDVTDISPSLTLRLHASCVYTLLLCQPYHSSQGLCLQVRVA